MGWHSSSGSPLGGQIETAELVDGSVTIAKLETAIQQPQWKYLDTLDFSADNSLTTGALAAHKRYKLVFQDMISSSNNDTMKLRINGDTGANYDHLLVNAGAFLIQTSQTGMSIGLVDEDVGALAGEVIVQGKSILGGCMVDLGNIGWHWSIVGLNGIWHETADTQITDFTVYGVAGNLTGKVYIYGAD